MGICADKPESTAEDKQQKTEARNCSKAIDKNINTDKKKDRQVNKLLLLGAGQSGKSTLFKQMNILYIEGFKDSERELYKNAVHSNIMVSMQALCENSDIFASKDSQFKINSDLEPSKKHILECSEEDHVNAKLAKMIIELWKDPGIQLTYKNRSKFQLNDSTPYFFDRINDVAKPGYIPTEQDVLRTRVPTTGIVEKEFEIEGNVFKMFDIGGQRSERKKWIHCFENVTAVLFIAAISAYDQVLYEDEQTNRMVESLDLFEEIANSEWFHTTAMILFLNKSDLFAEKITQVPLEDYFPAYVPEDEEIKSKYVSAVDWIVEQFESKGKQVYTHVTVATDSENILVVFNAVKDIVIKKGLERAGLT